MMLSASISDRWSFASRTFGVVGLVAIVFVVSGCQTRESPNGAYQKLVTGIRTDNYQSVVDSLSTETVNSTLEMTLQALRPQLGIISMTGPGREFIEIYRRHGVDLTKVTASTSNAQVIEQLSNRYSCLVDVIGYSIKLQKETKSRVGALAAFEKIGSDPNTALANIKYNGDRCTAEARYSIDGKNYREPLNFVRQGGEWRIAQVPSNPDQLASRSGSVNGAANVVVAVNSAHGSPSGHSVAGSDSYVPPGAHGESSPPAHAGAPGSAPSGHEQVAMAAATPSGHTAPPAAHSSETPAPVQSPEGHGPAAPTPQPEGAKPQTPAGHGEMANTPVGANPANPNAAPAAAEGVPPVLEGNGPAGNVPQAPTFPIGTAEYAVQKVCLAVAAGQYTGLDGVVSAKADGVLAQIRDGAVSEDEINSFKKRFGEVRLLSVKPRGSTKIVTLQNTGGEALVFTLAKEDEIFRVRDLEIKPPSARKKRP